MFEYRIFFKAFHQWDQIIVFCLWLIGESSTQLTKANFKLALLLPFQNPVALLKSVQWLISALPNSPYSKNVIFGSGHVRLSISPKLPPSLLPRQWKTSFAESIQAPSHLHVYQRSFTAQWPQQALSNGRIVLQNHPKSGLPASFPPAISSVVETPVSFLESQSLWFLLIGILPSLSAEMSVCGEVVEFSPWQSP